MIEPDQFDSLVEEVAHLNSLDADTAGDVVAAVGDTMELDEDGLVVARLDDGRILKVRWPEEDEEPASEDGE